MDGGGHGGLVKSSHRDACWSRCGAGEGRADPQGDPVCPVEPLGALQEEQGRRLLDPGQPDLRELAIQEEEEEIEEEAHGYEEDAGEEEKEVTVQLVHNCTIFLCSLDVINIDDQCRGPNVKEKDHLDG